MWRLIIFPKKYFLLLCEGVRGVHDELLGLGVVGGGSLHLHGVVAIAELGQPEAAHILQVVDTVYITAQYTALQSVQYIIVQYST